MQEVQQSYVKPVHVPDDVFLEGNVWEHMGDTPHACLKQRAGGHDIVFLQTHHHPGHSPNGAWVAVSAEVTRQILQDTDAFSSAGATIFGKLLGGLTFFPVEVDPPEHAKYRAIIAPYFGPAKIAAMKNVIAARADSLLDELLPRGGCEFIADFARIFPATIFLDLMGLPLNRAQDFLVWARTALAAPVAEDKTAALRRIRDYLADEIRKRRGSPLNDTLSGLANGQIDGRQLTVEEATGGALVLFLGGLDTVATQLGWVFQALANDSDMQEQLRKTPAQIPRASEEFFRFFSSVIICRRAARDVELGGVTIKAGDTVCCSLTLASRDDKEFAAADVLDISPPPRRQLAFGHGPHMCMGIHLAKLELNVVIERWLARAPAFRVVPGAEVPSHGGAVIGLDALPLTWA